jgi:hypothetical protein
MNKPKSFTPLLIQPSRMPCSSLMPAGACMGTWTSPDEAQC